MIKDRSKKPGMSHARSEIDADIAHRARITASLKEQRLKRDAEIAAELALAGPPVKPAKRAVKQKVA